MYYPESGDRPWTIQDISITYTGQTLSVHPLRMIRGKGTPGNLPGPGSGKFRKNLSVYFLAIFWIPSLFGNL